MKHSTKIPSACALALALAAASCASSVVVPENASAKQLIQGGQDEFSAGSYANALRFYNAALERFGDDPAVLVEAKYEIAHIYMKQEKYDYAENVLTEISSLYSTTMPGQLPGAYRKLAQIELEKLAEIRGTEDGD